MKAVIIDDEQNASDFIKSLLENYFPEVQVLGMAHSGKEGINLITQKNPDIVFLDIEMPEGNGFQVLEHFYDPKFRVIFTTAYNQYAINAIKFSAVDYLLKPINVSEFKKAVQKVKKLLQRETHTGQTYKMLIENIQSIAPSKLSIPTSAGIEFIDTNQIIRIEADRSYCNFYLSDRKILVSKCMGDYQELLQDKGFFRIHNSHLINLNYVAKYIKSDGGLIEMQNGIQLPISRNKKEVFQKVMNERSIK